MVNKALEYVDLDLIRRSLVAGSTVAQITADSEETFIDQELPKHYTRHSGYDIICPPKNFPGHLNIALQVATPLSGAKIWVRPFGCTNKKRYADAGKMYDPKETVVCVILHNEHGKFVCIKIDCNHMGDDIIDDGFGYFLACNYKEVTKDGVQKF